MPLPNEAILHDRRRARRRRATSGTSSARVRRSMRRSRPGRSTRWPRPIPTSTWQVQPVGTGPFRFEAPYDPASALELVANERYFLGAPKIQRITFPIIAGSGGRRAGPRGRRDRLAADAAGRGLRRDPRTTRTCASSSTTSRASSASISTCTPSRARCSSTATCARPWRTASTSQRPPGRRRTAAATAIYSEIPPESWAYPTDGLDEYPTDPAQARELIEASGWKRRRRRHLRQGRPPAVDGRRRPCGLPRAHPLARARRGAGPRVRHRAPVQGGPVRGDRPDARRLPARQRGRPRDRGGRSTRTSAGSTRPWSPIRSGCTTRPSARRPSGRPPSTTSATRVPPWTA